MKSVLSGQVVCMGVALSNESTLHAVVVKTKTGRHLVLISF